MGSYIHKLPVNQSFTCEAGCRIWGFPKSVEDIDFTYADDSATCRLTMDGRHVLTLTVPRGGDRESTDEQAVGYTMIEGVPHSNVFTRGGRGQQTVPASRSSSATTRSPTSCAHSDCPTRRRCRARGVSR